MNCEDHHNDLKSSSERIGRLYPVLLDKYGNVIDGEHRLAVDKNWPKVRLDHIQSERQRLVARLVGNVCRRKVPFREKNRMLEALGKIYLEEGLSNGEIAQRIAQDTGMSYRWVMKYLPDNLKARPGSGGPKRSVLAKYVINEEVARHATWPDFPSASHGETFLRINKYSNTAFVSVLIDRHFFSRIERLCDDLGTGPEVMICEALELMVRKLEGMRRAR